ncbi:hypothetical protein KIL84_013513 [Mauremys mutica]|uniref:Uncharacterized protein n=1 Tax=Mauremys mutica TaxID=74926 RepID=A0A9D3WX14_9SAUR|nr:hypothetical protein KIL84_013513 [Mauremys mutica]
MSFLAKFLCSLHNSGPIKHLIPSLHNHKDPVQLNRHLTYYCSHSRSLVNLYTTKRQLQSTLEFQLLVISGCSTFGSSLWLIQVSSDTEALVLPSVAFLQPHCFDGGRNKTCNNLMERFKCFLPPPMKTFHGRVPQPTGTSGTEICAAEVFRLTLKAQPGMFSLFRIPSRTHTPAFLHRKQLFCRGTVMSVSPLR